MTTQEIFTKNLNRLLHERDRTQLDLAKFVGVSNTTVNNWVKGYNTPRMDKIDKICLFFSIQREELLHENVPSFSKPPAVRIPVLGRVAAGIPIEAIEDVIDWEEIPKELEKNGEYFALQIHGTSMEPRMREGDVVIVRKQEDVESGDIAILRVNGNDATCKKVLKQENGLLVVGLNPSFEPIFYSMQQINSLPVEIAGKVVELRAKF